VGDMIWLENGCEITSDEVLALSSKDLLIVGFDCDVSVVQPIEYVVVPEEKKENYGKTTSICDFSEYVIPWTILTEDTKSALDSNTKLNDRAVREIVQAIHKDMRRYIQKNNKIPSKIFRSVVNKLTNAYPACFLEKSKDGAFISDSAEYIITKFINRDCYCISTTGNAKITMIPVAKKKKANLFKDTTSNYDGPVASETVETIETLGEKKAWLQEVYNHHGSDVAEEESVKIKMYMDAIFILQRDYINMDNPELPQIKKEFPFLLEKKYIFDYFSKLMDFDVERVGKNYREKLSKIISFGKTLTLKRVKTFFEKTTEIDESILMLQFIFNKFQEEETIIFKKFEVSNQSFEKH
jgi:hypothetical protein